VLGDLLPLPIAEAEDPEARAAHARAAEKWERISAAASAAGPPGAGDRGAAGGARSLCRRGNPAI
jgi:hypothetical protein